MLTGLTLPKPVIGKKNNWSLDHHGILSFWQGAVFLWASYAAETLVLWGIGEKRMA